MRVAETGTHVQQSSAAGQASDWLASEPLELCDVRDRAIECERITEIKHWPSIIAQLEGRADSESYLAVSVKRLDIDDEIYTLLQKTKWRYIEIIIDPQRMESANPIRGEILSALKPDLDLLIHLRSRTDHPFEIILCFILREDGFEEAVSYLDWCEQYHLHPRYCLDWEAMDGLTVERLKPLFATLERVDHELWSRGFPETVLAESFARLSPVLACNQIQQRRWPHMIYGDTTCAGFRQMARGLSRLSTASGPGIVILTGGSQPTSMDAGSREIRRGQTLFTEKNSAGVVQEPELQLIIPNDADAETIQRICTSLNNIAKKRERHRNRLLIYANNALKAHWNQIRESLTSSNISEYSIQIPYTERGHQISALEWREMVGEIKRFGQEREWMLLGGRPDAVGLGLDIQNQYPEITVRYTRQSHQLVELSIVAAIYNRATELPRFIRSVCKQEFEGALELVVVDDGSTDGSLAIAEELCAEIEAPLNIVLISLQRAIPYSPDTFTFRAGVARQRGIEHASGDQIVFIDPDQELEPGCLMQHRLWNQRGFDVVIGDRLYNFSDVYHPESISRSRLNRSSLWLSPQWWPAFYTGNSSVSRALLDTVGGFDEGLQSWGLDDTDLGYRLAQSGASFWHTLRASVRHIDEVASGGGVSLEDRERSCWFLMEVLFRKYLDEQILDAYDFLWRDGRRWIDALAEAD